MGAAGGAHLTFIRMNIGPTILENQFEDRMDTRDWRDLPAASTSRVRRTVVRLSPTSTGRALGTSSKESLTPRGASLRYPLWPTSVR